MGSKKRKWFQKGAFEDGYQFGDITKTILGTTTDAAQELGEGVLEMGEKVVDAGAYLVGGVGGLFGADKFKEKTADFIKKDLYDSEKLIKSANENPITAAAIPMLLKVMGTDEEESSILGEKSESLANSAGQMGAQIGLQAVKVPWWVTTGVTSFGSGVEESLNKGATYGKAGVNGAIRAGADILTEKLFGGSGLGEKGIFKLDGLTKGITNKTVKAFADWGIDLLANGEEEKLATVFTRLGDMLTTEREYTWKELLTDEKAMDDYIAKFVEYLTGDEAQEEYKEARIGGMALGGGANLGKVSKSISNNTDYRTGLTANEESVFDKVYESKITEAENGGNNLTGKQKAVIYDNALQQVKSGQVDTRTIEAALGGEDYSAYKNVLNNYEILQQKLSELQSIDNKAKTQEQTVKEQGIKQRLEQTKIKADKLKNILQNKVAEKIDIDNIHLKDRESYLWDSYVGKLPNFANDNLNSAKMSQEIDEDAVVEGLWDDGKSTVNSDSAEYVENSGLKLFDNVDGSWYNTDDIITDGSHWVDGKLKPNVKYKSGEYDYIYLTDDLGRISKVNVEELQYTERDYRERHNPNTPGKQQGDHAGHLIADRFGGSKELDNLVTQSSLVNLSEYKIMENKWANALNNGQKVSVDIDVQYDGNSMRPSGFSVTYSIDGSVTYKYIKN